MDETQSESREVVYAQHAWETQGSPEPQEPLGSRENGPQHARGTRGPQGPQGSPEPREPQEPQESQGSQGSSEPPEPQGSPDPRDPQALPDLRDPQGLQGSPEPQGARGPQSGTFRNKQRDFGSEPFIVARDLELKTLAGYVYRNVSVNVHKGELVAVRGRNGSGKTSLLLALAGRMKHTGGSLTIGGWDLPRQRAKAARQVGMALFEGLNDLQDSLTVAYATSAEFELYGRKPRREDVMASLGRWHLDDVADLRVKDLNSEQLTVLGISLAFVRHPDIVVVDDIEAQLTLEQSKRLMQLLHDLARDRATGIIVGITERDLAAMADTCVYLSKEGE